MGLAVVVTVPNPRALLILVNCEAIALFTPLAREPSFYGLLAADELGAPAPWAGEEWKPGADDIAALTGKATAAYFNLETIISSETNFKSKLIEWCQRQGKSVKFEMMEMKRNKSQKEFTAQVMMDEQLYEKGYGASKKKAEQDAAQKTCLALGLE